MRGGLPPPTLTLPILLRLRARDISSFFLIAARSRSRSSFIFPCSSSSSISSSSLFLSSTAPVLLSPPSTALILTLFAFLPSVSSAAATATRERLVPGVTTLDARLPRGLEGLMGTPCGPPSVSDLRFLFVSNLPGDAPFLLAYHSPSPSIF